MIPAERPVPDRYRDGFIRETARRIYFLLSLSDRFDEPARLMEELRRTLCDRRRAEGRCPPPRFLRLSRGGPSGLPPCRQDGASPCGVVPGRSPGIAPGR